MAILNLKKRKFYQNKTPMFFKRCRYLEVLASNKISFDEKNYKYFIGYLDNDHKVKPLHTMLPKTRTYIIHYHGQT